MGRKKNSIVIFLSRRAPRAETMPRRSNDPASPGQGGALPERFLSVIRRHLAACGGSTDGRVLQGPDVASVLYADTGRMWLHRNNRKRSALQEFYFHAAHSTVGTLTASHRIKLWDLGRYLSDRETVRIQGFPETMVLPRTRATRLIGNAVAVPCAAAAIAAATAGGGPWSASHPLRHIDVCAGIGGFSWAVRHPGSGIAHACTVGFSEIERAAVQCYRANFPDVCALGDARQTDATWPSCHLLTAGFPCQPFSASSSRDHRSSHPQRDFVDVVLHWIETTGCVHVVLENVPTLPTLGAPQWTRLCDGLHRMGFAVRHAVLDASSYGLPQQRRRLYVMARRDGESPPTVPSAPRADASSVTLRAILDASVDPIT